MFLIACLGNTPWHIYFRTGPCIQLVSLSNCHHHLYVMDFAQHYYVDEESALFVS